MIIAITGMPLAGKASVRRIFENMGCPAFAMSTAVREEAKKQRVKIDKVSMREFATKIREERGRGVVAEFCIPHLKEMLRSEDLIIVDGVRSPEEPEVFKNQFGDDFALVCIWAPFKLRVRRLGGEDRVMRDDAVGTEMELKMRDRKELTWGLGEVIAEADYLITNTGQKEDLQKDLNRFLRSIIARGMKKITEWK
jgi:dephospho-CoA kinase